MYLYNNFGNKIKGIYFVKVGWLLFLILSSIYCIIILSLSDIIDHVSLFLIPVLFFNTLSLIFALIDIWIIIQFGLVGIIIPIGYYIATGSGRYKFVVYEFLVILIYTIPYVIIIICLIVSCGIGLYYYMVETTQSITERESINNIPLETGYEIISI